MKLDQFEFFLQVAETHSMQEAADILHTSVQNVSKTIIALEKELNIKLFTRNSYGTFLSAEGSELYPYARNIMDNVSEIQKKYLSRIDSSPNQAQQISILCARILQDDIHNILYYIRQQSKQISGSFSTNDPGEINPLLDEDVFRLLDRFEVITTAVFSEANHYIRYDEVPVYLLDKGLLGVCVNRSSSLASQPMVSIKQLLQYHLVLYTTDTGRYSLIQQALDHLNCHITPQYTSNTVSISQQLIEENSLNYSFVFYRPSMLEKHNQSNPNLIVPLAQHAGVDYLMFLNPKFAHTDYGKLFINETKRIYPNCQRIKL